MIVCFDCKDGVSGDMLVGALVDLGADVNYIKEKLKSLKLDNFDITFSKINKKGLPATDFNVILEDSNHDHDMKYLYGNGKNKIEITTKRNLQEVDKILRKSNLSESEIQISLEIFDIIAEAEAKAHHIDKNDVIFHENGAMDSIIDIVSFALCIKNLGIEKVYVKNLSEGYGKINTRVGILPIPTPAVKNILEKFNLTYEKAEIEGELITPTGIACLAYLGDFSVPKYEVIKVGYGAGKRDYKTSCCVRIEEIAIEKSN